jgi:hypothetical protein
MASHASVDLSGFTKNHNFAVNLRGVNKIAPNVIILVATYIHDIRRIQDLTHTKYIYDARRLRVNIVSRNSDNCICGWHSTHIVLVVDYIY